MWLWGMIGITLCVLFLIGVIKTTLGIVEPRSGYSCDFLERTLGRVKVGEEEFTGRYTGVYNGFDSYLIMTRNDDLEPPYQVTRTIMCPTCEEIILPICGCRCRLSPMAGGCNAPMLEFKDSLPGSFTHQYLA